MASLSPFQSHHGTLTPTPSPSQRSLANIKVDLMMDLTRAADELPAYNQEDEPNGLIDMTSSINTIMSEEDQKYIAKVLDPDDVSRGLQYGPAAGSPELLEAIARYLNHHFRPSHPVLPTDVMATNGVSSLIDLVAFTACDAGDAIMFTTPAYGMFKHDITSRNQVNIVEVPCANTFDQFASKNASALVAKMEEACFKAASEGVRVKAVLLCNPHNPLGRCYSRTSLIRIAELCGKWGLHLVSDEIYAMSGFQSRQEFDSFTSVMSIAEHAKISPQAIHVLYGVSKDFGFGGLRLGFLITKHEIFKEACRRLAVSTWTTKLSDQIMTRVLSDDEYLRHRSQIYKQRLATAYEETTAFLSKHQIRFDPANAGLFIWIDLRAWLLLPIPGSDPKLSVDIQLTYFLLQRGVFLEPGEAFSCPYPGRYRLVYTQPEAVRTLGLQRLVRSLQELQSGSDTGSMEMFLEEKASPE